MQPNAASDAPILSVRGLSKSFGGLKAVQNVGFDVSKGAIRAAWNVLFPQVLKNSVRRNFPG